MIETHVHLAATLLTKPMTQFELAEAGGVKIDTARAFIAAARKHGLVYQAGMRATPLRADGTRQRGPKQWVFAVQPLPFFHRDYNHTL